ncbi:DUF2635 domain-containing protein [Serratia marcescens]|uniref:DUF2635 domain-containing protein n=1 Tax=Serratia marcescens TaxID=615 RepID=A0ABD5BHR0_SERMA|nr:DUF2635 domain-containing protein [Serratia marcescens]MCZ6928680.1 hypothetical protein [Serratia marcescens]MDE5234333.1 DUF2635 domain-containing protein [Serratia marcescens]MDE5257500.1 DUF2635 domain-containing protein [Serratia marcescens]MDQ9402288.1 DUF2635 domain-containing protein [Serratia marcescens]MDQ9424661.1 DUF2635 domain-containing protein [Serratia marcescens]
MKTKILKPKNGIKVRKQNGEYLSAAGETITLNAYWLRRIAEGDLDVTDVAAPKAEVATETEANPTKSSKAEK